MNREQAIKYFNQRLKELQAYMCNVSCEKERLKIFDKYRRFYEVLKELEGEEEW